MPAEAALKSQPAESRTAKTIREVFDSGRPLTYILSAEEQRIARALGEVAERRSGLDSRCRFGHGA